eukprot:GHVQ01015704.1.p1 GENE.GHVQ01015704.1~~GHVQ01015704.1.p1  ORF type:complete len:571 (+),score=73.82 GHVQ01015704.1:46-1758(+)
MYLELCITIRVRLFTKKFGRTYSEERRRAAKLADDKRNFGYETKEAPYVFASDGATPWWTVVPSQPFPYPSSTTFRSSAGQSDKQTVTETAREPTHDGRGSVDGDYEGCVSPCQAANVVEESGEGRCGKGIEGGQCGGDYVSMLHEAVERALQCKHKKKRWTSEQIEHKNMRNAPRLFDNLDPPAPYYSDIKEIPSSFPRPREPRPSLGALIRMQGPSSGWDTARGRDSHNTSYIGDELLHDGNSCSVRGSGDSRRTRPCEEMRSIYDITESACAKLRSRRGRQRRQKEQEEINPFLLLAGDSKDDNDRSCDTNSTIDQDTEAAKAIGQTNWRRELQGEERAADYSRIVNTKAVISCPTTVAPQTSSKVAPPSASVPSYSFSVPHVPDTHFPSTPSYPAPSSRRGHCGSLLAPLPREVTSVAATSPPPASPTGSRHGNVFHSTTPNDVFGPFQSLRSSPHNVQHIDRQGNARTHSRKPSPIPSSLLSHQLSAAHTAEPASLSGAADQLCGRDAAARSPGRRERIISPGPKSRAYGEGGGEGKGCVRVDGGSGSVRCGGFQRVDRMMGCCR